MEYELNEGLGMESGKRDSISSWVLGMNGIVFLMSASNWFMSCND